MPPATLTPNAIAAVVSGGDLDLKPLMQVVEVKPIRVGQQERYRMSLSDGGGATQAALLAVQLNDLVRSGKVKKGAVVQLLDYMCNKVNGRSVIVILNMEIVVDECGLIGNPNLPPEDAISQKGSSITSTGYPRAESLNGTSRSVPPTRINVSTTMNAGNKDQSFHPTVQPSYKPPPNFKNYGTMSKNVAPPRVIPITALNPYQGRWAIKARVTAKGDLRRYNNAKGDGKVFSFDLLDSDGGEIRVTCFNAVVDRFYDVIEAGKIYLISKGNLKPAQKSFNHLNNEWEIFLEATSTVNLCPEEDDSIPTQQFNFRPITEIENAENNSILDVIGIVMSVNPSTTITRKNGMETQRRILNMKDVSGRSVEITLWGDYCNNEGRQLQDMLDSGDFPVLAVKSGKVNDFSGKSVGTISASQLFIDPEFPEARSLRNWFDGEGRNTTSQSISKDTTASFPRNEIRKTVSQIKDEGLGRGNKPDWVTVKATISFVKSENFCYTACPIMIGDRQCNKKVTKVSNGNWCCDRCNQEFEDCDYRYLLSVQVQDHTGITWVTAFQESGEELLGCSAKDLYILKNEDHDVVEFGKILQRCLFEQYIFKLKIKEEMYGDEQRVNITVVKAEKVNPSAESNYLLELISKFSI